VKKTGALSALQPSLLQRRTRWRRRHKGDLGYYWLRCDYADWLCVSHRYEPVVTVSSRDLHRFCLSADVVVPGISELGCCCCWPSDDVHRC